MPPRADFDVPGSVLAPASLVLLASANKPKPRSESSPPAERPERPRPRQPILFRNTHGIVGSVATALTCLALAVRRGAPSPRASLADPAALCAGAAAVAAAASGASIVGQAPLQTVVMERPFRVVPPHRDAFARTASSIYYICGRLFWNVCDARRGSWGVGGAGALDWARGGLAVAFALRHFVPRPRDVDWANGNTYVFVVPMALGLTGDALFQLPGLQCAGGVCWNADVITQVDLLWVQLSGLVMAFAFTLAFRGVLSLKSCYWGAALAVHGIAAFLVAKALPFARAQLLPSWAG